MYKIGMKQACGHAANIRCSEAFGYSCAETKSIFTGRLRIVHPRVTIGQFLPNYLSQRAKRIVAQAGRAAR